MFGFLKDKLKNIKEKISEVITTKSDSLPSPHPSTQPLLSKELPSEKPKETPTPKKPVSEKPESKPKIPTPKEIPIPPKPEIPAPRIIEEKIEIPKPEIPTPREPEQILEKLKQEIIAPREPEPKKEKKGFLEKIFGAPKPKIPTPKEIPKPEIKTKEVFIKKEPEILTPKEFEKQKIEITKKIEDLLPLTLIKKEIEIPKPKIPAPRIIEEKIEIPKPEIPKEKTKPKEIPIKEKQPKLGILTKAKAIFTQKVKLSEQEIDSLLFDIEMSLIQADVESETAQQLTKYMKESLLQKEFSKDSLSQELDATMKKAIEKLIDIPYPNLIEEIKQKKKPVKILFFGPNGAGKTTTIAKIAEHLKQENLTSILAAGDTFRAASIEQIKKHADRLNLRLISHSYGADPSAVAFDAIKSAEANNIDVVLIDTAGRQETNTNLLKELGKIVRVSKPDYKIYVGESISGTAILNQAREFNKEFGLDGFILTKLDLDPKGGSALSLIYNLQKPIYFFGTGQTYKDLKHFSKQELLNQIL